MDRQSPPQVTRQSRPTNCASGMNCSTRCVLSTCTRLGSARFTLSQRLRYLPGWTQPTPACASSITRSCFPNRPPNCPRSILSQLRVSYTEYPGCRNISSTLTMTVRCRDVNVFLLYCLLTVLRAAQVMRLYCWLTCTLALTVINRSYIILIYCLIY